MSPMNQPMHAKFAISYTVFPEHNKRIDTHYTDDPVAAESFLMHLLASGSRIIEIRHNGTALDAPQFDRMLRVAVGRLAARLLSVSLAMDYADVKHRYGFAE
jgi:hypothetical protein